MNTRNPTQNLAAALKSIVDNPSGVAFRVKNELRDPSEQLINIGFDRVSDLAILHRRPRKELALAGRKP